MRLKLIENAREVNLKSFAQWCSYLGFLSLLLPAILIWILGDIPVSPDFLFWLGMGLYAAGIIGRNIDQGLWKR